MPPTRARRSARPRGTYPARVPQTPEPVFGRHHMDIQTGEARGRGAVHMMALADPTVHDAIAQHREAACICMASSCPRENW